MRYASLACHECGDPTRYYVRINHAQGTDGARFRPVCLTCALESEWLAEGMPVHDIEAIENPCFRCGGDGAAGAAGLCDECHALADEQERAAEAS